VLGATVTAAMVAITASLLVIELISVGSFLEKRRFEAPVPSMRFFRPPQRGFFCKPGAGHLEQVPKKLTDFFDQNLLQSTDLARFLIDQTIPSDRKAR
jgi:hypothetical protein